MIVRMMMEQPSNTGGNKVLMLMMTMNRTNEPILDSKVPIMTMFKVTKTKASTMVLSNEDSTLHIGNSLTMTKRTYLAMQLRHDYRPIKPITRTMTLTSLDLLRR